MGLGGHALGKRYRLTYGGVAGKNSGIIRWGIWGGDGKGEYMAANKKDVTKKSSTQTKKETM